MFAQGLSAAAPVGYIACTFVARVRGQMVHNSPCVNILLGPGLVNTNGKSVKPGMQNGMEPWNRLWNGIRNGMTNDWIMDY